MSDQETHHTLVGHLVGTARAHHAATGGPNPQWASWYAEHALDDVNSTLGTSLTVDELAAWLADADRRYREADQDQSWPKAYATWMIEELA